jgi:hypothetical protein
MGGMRFLADEYVAGARLRSLRVAFQAQVIVPLDQHFGVNRTVRVMANDAALPQRLMFIDERLGLLAMTRSARLVEPRHGQAAPWFADVQTVRIVALDAIHFVFEHRMMLGQIELGVRLQMTIKTRRRIFAGIHDVFAASPTGGDVQAAGPVA